MKEDIYLHTAPIFKIVNMPERSISCGFGLLLPNENNQQIQIIFNFGFGLKILYIGFKICWDDKCKLSHEM